MAKPVSQKMLVYHYISDKIQTRPHPIFSEGR